MGAIAIAVATSSVVVTLSAAALVVTAPCAGVAPDDRDACLCDRSTVAFREAAEGYLALLYRVDDLALHRVRPVPMIGVCDGSSWTPEEWRRHFDSPQWVGPKSSSAHFVGHDNAEVRYVERDKWSLQGREDGPVIAFLSNLVDDASPLTMRGEMRPYSEYSLRSAWMRRYVVVHEVEHAFTDSNLTRHPGDMTLIDHEYWAYLRALDAVATSETLRQWIAAAPSHEHLRSVLGLGPFVPRGGDAVLDHIESMTRARLFAYRASDPRLPCASETLRWLGQQLRSDLSRDVLRDVFQCSWMPETPLEARRAAR